MSKKIAFLSLNYKPSMGGLVRYIESYSSFIINCGGESKVFCSDAKNESLLEMEILDGVVVNRYKIFRGLRIFDLFTPIRACINLRKEVKNIDWSQYDLIVVRHLYSAAALLGNKQAQEKAVYLCPLISCKLQNINAKNSRFLYKLYSFFLAPQLFLIERMVFSKFKNIGVLSESKRAEVVEYFNIDRTVNVIAPGVDFSNFYPSSHIENMESRKKLRIENDEFVFITVCRLVEEKNVSLLIRSFSKIRKENDNVKLVIVGDGPLMTVLKAEAKELGCGSSVLFTGYVEEPRYLYSLSNCFVLPSFYEGFGHVFLEANSCGIPSIGFKNNPPLVVTATDEIISEGVNGYISEDCTVDGLFLTMNKAVKNKNIIKNDSIIKYIQSNFSWCNHHEKLLAIINDKH
ncbi:Glycosyl transferase family 1 domain-containing protein [Vibrio crassostreae]|uniref:Glycosyl transferase family 1 domain-containing protein n=1 Tax=Vibrio crassostreae TaxID=246167 RepID=A0A822N530_9VIBR|nr:glycosyltransferase family 4 protein [Vibrio crassostreae]MDH5952947.1 glycosyltransferase family 4 protein [Vibrio crassostreae]ROR17240.1 glycosyltransferase involved in cell wall biosynthesis [Vibrio crassostreae]TCN07169.1 glycosyltransferase involved in cell wall biosynthesis [Vibrio crassostreae]TCU07547.1 glycosyltransferase involved in cell wall biosynthesis [Vibrio crassostreae]CAK2209657.1 Glycosyl transferase family 1 domain-containing protein [Vibrio crassostreae]